MDFVIAILSGIGRATDRIMSDPNSMLGLMILVLVIYAIVDIVCMPRRRRGKRRPTQSKLGRGKGQEKLPDPKEFW